MDYLKIGTNRWYISFWSLNYLDICKINAHNEDIMIILLKTDELKSYYYKYKYRFVCLFLNQSTGWLSE